MDSEAPQKNHPVPCSSEFLNAVMRGGSIAQECGFCGRLVFADTQEAGDWDEGELEDLRKAAQREPGKYVADGENDSISYGELDGRMLVWGCPCHSGRRYEDFIWQHRQIIADYLVAQTRNQLEEALANNRLAEKVAGGLTAMEKMATEVARMQALCRLQGVKFSQEDAR